MFVMMLTKMSLIQAHYHRQTQLPATGIDGVGVKRLGVRVSCVAAAYCFPALPDRVLTAVRTQMLHAARPCACPHPYML